MDPALTIYTLSADDQARCRTFAHKLLFINQTVGAVELKVSRKPAIALDLEGVAGELAFCRLYGLELNTSLSKEHGPNAVLCGRTIDVKTTRHSKGRLIARAWNAPDVQPDYFALMIGTFPTYTLIGFMKSKELLRPERIGQIPGSERPTYIAEQWELHFPWAFEELLKPRK